MSDIVQNHDWHEEYNTYKNDVIEYFEKTLNPRRNEFKNLSDSSGNKEEIHKSYINYMKDVDDALKKNIAYIDEKLSVMNDQFSIIDEQFSKMNEQLSKINADRGKLSNYIRKLDDFKQKVEKDVEKEKYDVFEVLKTAIIRIDKSKSKKYLKYKAKYLALKKLYN